MKNKYLAALLALLPAASMTAQDVDRTKYPDYDDTYRPDYSLLQAVKKARALKATGTGDELPDHWNNADFKHFPPVFNQDGGSCGSASRICYMFTHELNSFRDADGSDMHNQYPSHFVWLHTNTGSNKDVFVEFVGVPSAYTYGGRTYSKLFGNQVESQPDFGWMTGYEKWYEGMFNRTYTPTHLPMNVGTEEGRELLKRWLWNHCGDSDFHSGGLAGIGVASAVTSERIASTPNNDVTGAVGKKYVKKWGTTVDHALTIVGYDDRIEFDLNGNGIYGEKSADEVGAWIIVNSWGSGWANNGFIYCPYAYGGASFDSDGNFRKNWWAPELYKVRKNYRPERTIRVKMDYSRRSELSISAGVSSDINATEPDVTMGFHHFQYAGDGNNGRTTPAPEIPMLGRWADGRLHDEPMEFGYDLTDFTASYDKNKPLKYFLVINTKAGALGTGHIYDAAIMDYTLDENGVEIPFDIAGAEGVEIKNDGQRTLISVVVQGYGIHNPTNARIGSDNIMRWDAPQRSGHVITGYRIYDGDMAIANLPATTLQYTPQNPDEKAYSVTALYGQLESEKVMATKPSYDMTAQSIRLSKSGMTLPHVFDNRYANATIEYWIKPTSIAEGSHSFGPGWGSFHCYSGSGGVMYAGWDSSNRVTVNSAYTVGIWRHIAIVVEGNKMSVYVNGVRKSSVTSKTYSGLGGFGDLVFNYAEGTNTFTNAQIDELRIWNTARTADEIKKNYKKQFAAGAMPGSLVAYYKGDLVQVGEEEYLRDHTQNGHHARFTTDAYDVRPANAMGLTIDSVAAVTIDSLTTAPIQGLPVRLSATTSAGVKELIWNVPGAGVADLHLNQPSVIFGAQGSQTAMVTAIGLDGSLAHDTLAFNVVASEAPRAAFTASKTSASAGEQITFLVTDPQPDFSYEWSIPGSNHETAGMVNVGAVFSTEGVYTVTLTVTSPDGRKAVATKEIHIYGVPPVAALNVSPAVVLRGQPVGLTSHSLYGPTTLSWTVANGHRAMIGEGERIVFAPTKAGIYDVSLTATNAHGHDTYTEKNALTVCNADSKTGLTFEALDACVTAAGVPFQEGQSGFTIDFWLNYSTLAAEGNAIGDSKSTFLLNTTLAHELVVNINGKSAKSSSGYLIPNGWHHYAVACNENGNIRFYRDGESINVRSIGVKQLPAINKFALGQEDLYFHASIDELRVWGKYLSQDNIREVANQPLEGDLLAKAKDEYALQLYYDFNQAGSDLTDLSGHGHTGVRSGFGPAGDAFGSSLGVFCLDFDDESEDVTSKYLVNYKADFNITMETYNPNGASMRFMTLADWTRENEGNTSQRTGAHVDANKGYYMTITTGWDGFADELADHKVYQTVTLEPGLYTFTANFGTYEGQAEGCYLVAAKGKGLPNTADLPNESINYLDMEAKSSTVTSNALLFQVAERTEVSLGIVANMSGKQCVAIRSFALNYCPVEVMQPLPDGIGTIQGDNPLIRGIYDMNGRRVNAPRRGNLYIIDGNKVVAE